jgi:serine protease Do
MLWLRQRPPVELAAGWLFGVGGCQTGAFMSTSSRASWPVRPARTFHAWLLATLCLLGLPGLAADNTPRELRERPAPVLAAASAASASEAHALERAAKAVVGVQANALKDARSASTLGRTRQGSGVVIDGDGLVLTIGYLILEADQVRLLTDDQRRVPARVVAYDTATGLGLLRALVPLNIEPAPMGSALEVTAEEPLMIASGGSPGAISTAQLVSRRRFAGYWEYLLDDALFTTPPRPDHSGAGLFNARGELVGIGSLLVNDAAGTDQHVPGNMFVPIDVLRPILPELLSLGRSRRSERPWMGASCVEIDGRVRVVRVAEDSPAAAAGLAVGDQILKLDGQAVSSLEGLWTALWQGTDSERVLRLDIDRAGEVRSTTVHTVDRDKNLRRAEGI